MSAPTVWVTRRGMTTSLIAVVVLLSAACAIPSPSPSDMPASATARPSTDVAQPLRPGEMAQTTSEVDAYLEPGGATFATLDAGAEAMIVDEPTVIAGAMWYRVEFSLSSGEWVFGWLAADLQVPPREPGANPDASVPPTGPALRRAAWACPADPNQLGRIPEPLRVRCFSDRILTLNVTIFGHGGRSGYWGSPSWLIEPAQIASTVVPLHVPPNVELYRALADPRVKAAIPVVVVGRYADPASAACRRVPLLAGYPNLDANEMELWCRQQFVASEIRLPDIPIPSQPEGWVAGPGFQPPSGPGWRLLGSANASKVGITVTDAVTAADDASEYQILWLGMGLGPDAPAVDLDREFVARLVVNVSGIGGFCAAARLDGIGVDSSQRLVYGIFATSFQTLATPPPENVGCTTDAAPHAFLVAIDRSIAPSSPFTLRLRKEPSCTDCDYADEITMNLGFPAVLS